jgi:hypothetical protein
MQGKYDLAETYAARTLAARRQALGSEDPDTMTSAVDLATVYIEQDKFADAEPLARDARGTERKIQPDLWPRYRAETVLGESLAGQRKFAEAEPLIVEGFKGMLARKERIAVPDQYHLDRAREWLVRLYAAWGKPAKVAEWRGN